MPEINELFHTIRKSFELILGDVKGFVLFAALALAGAYYLLVALKSMFPPSKGHQMKHSMADFPPESHER